MDKFPLNYNNPLIRFNAEHLNGYGFLLMIFTLMFILGYYFQKKLRGYLKNRNQLKQMAEDYERKRESRNELKFHYFWAIDRGEHKNAENIGYEILQMDKELRELYEQYLYYKEKGFYPLKRV